MRRSFDAQCAAVVNALKQLPLAGHRFLRRSKRRDRVNALIWDRKGLATIRTLAAIRATPLRRLSAR